MKSDIIFILDTQIIYKNNKIDEADVPNSQFIVIYFQDIGLSYEYAKEFIKNRNVCFFSDISIFFIQSLDNLYSYSLGDYTIHISKNSKYINTTFSSFTCNCENLEEFLLKNTKLDSMFFRLCNSKLNFSIILHYINSYFFSILCLMLIFFIAISYTIYIPNVDFDRKKFFYNIFFTES